MAAIVDGGVEKKERVIEMSPLKTCGGPGWSSPRCLCKDGAGGGAVPGAEPAVMRIGQMASLSFVHTVPRVSITKDTTTNKNYIHKLFSI